MKKRLSVLLLIAATIILVTGCNDKDTKTQSAEDTLKESSYTEAEIDKQKNEAPSNEASDLTQKDEKAKENSIESTEDIKAQEAESEEETNLEKMGLTVTWAEDSQSSISDYDEVNLAQGDIFIGVLFNASKDISNFKILNLEFKDCDDEGKITFNVTVAEDYGTLKKEFPLVVDITMVGEIPNNGFSFTDANGHERIFSIGESGKDGSIYIEEVNK